MPYHDYREGSLWISNRAQLGRLRQPRGPRPSSGTPSIYRSARGGRTHMPDGTVIPDHLEARAATRLRDRLLALVDQAVSVGDLPGRPYPPPSSLFVRMLDNAGRGRKARRAAVWLVHLRRLVVVNRDGYTCRYCSRTAWGDSPKVGTRCGSNSTTRRRPHVSVTVTTSTSQTSHRLPVLQRHERPDGA